MKHRALAVLAAALVALLATACAGVPKPTGWTSPVATGNRLIVVQERPGQVVAIDPRDGSPVWHFPDDVKASKAGGRVPRPVKGTLYASPVVDGDAVYLASYEGHVTRLDYAGGNLTAPWQVELKTTVIATPLLRAERLYVFAEDGRLFVLNAATGSTVATHRPTEGRVWGAPALRGDTIYLGSLDSGETIALDAGTGAVLWRQRLAGATAADLVFDHDLLLVGSFDRALHALDVTADGIERWRFDGDGWFMGAPLATGDAIYAATMRGSVYGLNDSGKQQWVYTRAGAEFRAQPLLAAGTLVVAARDGSVVGLDPGSGEERWVRTAADAHIDANGLLLESNLFYVTTERTLLRVDPANGSIQTFTVQPQANSGGK